MREGLEKLLMWPELERDYEGCEKVQGVLEAVSRLVGKGEEGNTLRKGRPRFVVFIMWEDVDGPSLLEAIVAKGG